MVKVAADLHSLKLSQPAKVVILLAPGSGDKDSLVPLELSGGKRQPPVVLAILQQALLDEILSINLDEIARYAGAQEFVSRFSVNGFARRVDTVSQRYYRAPAANLAAWGLAKNIITNSR